MRNVTPESIRKAGKEFAFKHAVCTTCLGVGCEPQHFGMGNPDAQPCHRCNGRGYVERQLSFNF